ncbi:MAG TPA: hypothetical protein VF952_20330 [Chloroflexia bacterium]|jgi:hypothetical protein
MNTETRSYKVLVNDNFHYMDASESYQFAEFDSCTAAVTACVKIVDDYLLANYKPGMTTEELYRNYTTFGEDPFVLTKDEQCQFSAWNYARQRCDVLCEPQEEPQ